MKYSRKSKTAFRYFNDRNTINYCLYFPGRKKIITKQKQMKESRTFIALSILLLCLATHLSYGQGSRYTGNYIKSSPIQHAHKNNIVIEGLEFTNSNPSLFGGRAISLWKCENVIIRNCKFTNVAWETAILVENGLNVTITDCVFENVYQAVRVPSGRGNIKFENNEVRNLVKGLHNGNGGGGVQLVESNGPGYSINYNVFESLPENTYTIDVIGIYRSNGTPESPITIKGNWIRGGGPLLNSGGILLGDIGGSYQIAEDNILVNPGQYGIAIAGGHNMTLRNNKVYAKQQPFTNVGLVLANWTHDQLGPSYNIVVENNAINWISSTGAVGTAWVSENMKAAVPNWRQASVRDASILPSILPEVIFGRARLPQDTSNPPSNPTTPPGNENGGLPIVYIDTFNRICVNYSGETYYLTSFSISRDGKILVDQVIDRYHTVVNKKFGPGEYDVMVEYDGKIQNSKLVLK